MGKKEIFYILITAFLFSTMEVALKIAGNDLDPFQVNFIRFAVGGLFLLPFALRDIKKRQVKLNKTDIIYLFALGIICICISMLAFQLALLYANANLVAIIICSNPIFTMIFAHFLANDRFTKKKALVLLLSLIGLTIVANPFNLGEGNSLIGILLSLLAAASFGLYSALGKRRIEKIGDIPQTSLSFIFGSLVMMVVMLIMDKPIVSGIEWGNIPLIIYLGVFVTGIGYYFYFEAIHACGPSNASIVFFLKPIFAPIVAFIILQEPITNNIIIGLVFILAGSYINIRKPKKQLAQNTPNYMEEAPAGPESRDNILKDNSSNNNEDASAKNNDESKEDSNI